VRIFKLFFGLCTYLFANILSLFFYRRKYIKGKYFSGKYGGIFAIGWKWIVNDCIARIFLGVNKGVPFPISPFSRIGGPPGNITFDVNDLNNFQSKGIYIQAMGKITIGSNTYIAANVGIITSNHKIKNLEFHDEPKDVFIGNSCWIGMNSVVLPGVTLGDHTIVGAGSIVTKSFYEGNCVIAGNPAVKIKNLM